MTHESDNENTATAAQAAKAAKDHGPLDTFLGCIGVIYALTLVALPLYWVFTDSGLAAVVTEAQVAVLPGDRYYPVLSWMCPTLALMSPILVAMMFMSPNDDVDPESGTPLVDGTDSADDVETTPSRLRPPQ